jgi:peptide/nickel transport system permease protein
MMKKINNPFWNLALRNTSVIMGSIIFFSLVFFSIVGPHLTSHDAYKMNIRDRMKPPVFIKGGTWAHPLGTDDLGRDLLARVLGGLRVSLIIGFSTVIIIFSFGSALGMIAGYSHGLVDTIQMRITDAQLSLPLIVLAIAILGVTRPNMFSIILVLSISSWPIYARVTRGIVLGEREKEYVRAAKIIGSSGARIILKYIAPGILPSVALVAVLDIARMIIFEAILGFLGLSIQPPQPSFGNIIADGRKYLVNAWWIATMPGVVLSILLVSINMMGSGFEKVRKTVIET